MIHAYFLNSYFLTKLFQFEELVGFLETQIGSIFGYGEVMVNLGETMRQC